MFAYRTNNPQYLEYIAKFMSREDIANHPQLCQWMNNPYTKDNMELAIRFHEAEVGTFENKKSFVEYYMCNGPEIDADTMLYYREKILIDPEYKQIAYTFYSDLDKVVQLRSNIYGKTNVHTQVVNGKKNEWFDCFKNPCNYLGPFSCRSGFFADAGVNASTPENVMAERRYFLSLNGKSGYQDGPTSGEKKGGKDEDKEKENDDDEDLISDDVKKFTNERAKAQGKTVPFPEVEDDGDKLPPAEGASGSTPADAVGGPFSFWFTQKMPPAMQEMYFAYIKQRQEQIKKETEEHVRNGTIQNTQVGDEKAISMGECIRLLAKANQRRFLGDCARLWSQMRNFNPYDPSQNQQKPIASSDIINNTNPDGGKAVKEPSSPINLAAPASEVKRSLFERGLFDEYLKARDAYQETWEIVDFYNNLLRELMKQQPNWEEVKLHIASFYKKSNKKAPKNWNWKDIQQRLMKFAGDQEAIENILGSIGISCDPAPVRTSEQIKMDNMAASNLFGTSGITSSVGVNQMTATDFVGSWRTTM